MLFCVAGVFVLGFNGLAVVLASNAGTLAVYKRAKRALQALRVQPGAATLPVPDPGRHRASTLAD